MASIHRRGRDKKRRHAPWYVTYTDHCGKRRTRKGFTDKGLTEQLAAKLENDVMMRKSGLIDSELEEIARLRRSGIEEHLVEFERSLTRRNNTAKHVSRTVNRVRRVVTGCGFKSLGEIRGEAVERFLADFRVEQEIGHRTFNHYVQAFEQFCKWLVSTGRLPRQPFSPIARLNNETDVRHQRRALTIEELQRLVDAARSSTRTIQCFDGQTRARLYLLAFATGLRRSEIASLTPSSFSLDATPPMVTILASVSKHRRQDVLALNAELANEIRGWIEGLAPDQVLFPKLAKRRTWRMVKLDLEAAGISYRTAAGVADFHAAHRGQG